MPAPAGPTPRRANKPPSLAQHRTSQLVRAGPPASVASVLSAFGFRLGTLPLASFGACDPGRRIDARLLTFRARAADQDHAASTPDTAWPGTWAPAKLISREKPGPRFRCHLDHFRRLNDDAPPSLPSRAILERLPGPHLTGSSPALSLDAHHDSLQLTQLQGGLTPTPAGRRRRAIDPPSLAQFRLCTGPSTRLLLRRS